MISLLLACCLGLLARASEDHGGGEDARSGVGRAVLETDARLGLRLSQKALKALGVRLAPAGAGVAHVPASALVRFQEEVGVYRLRQGWLKLVHVEASERGGWATAHSKELGAGDQIVVAGAALLRVAELDALGGEGEGDEH